MVLLVYWRTSLTANLLLNAPEGGKISRQAPRGSFATLPTHFKWITGFDAGSQAFSLTRAGCCGQDWQVFRVLEQQAIIAALYQHYFFYHYSAILIHNFLKYFRALTSISDQEPRERQNSALACLQSCIHQQSQNRLVYGHEAVCHHWLGGGSNLIINEEINLTWPAGN